MTGWRVRDEKRLIGFAQLLPGIPLVLYGFLGSELALRTTLLVMATAVSILGIVRVGLTAWRLARGPEPAPDGLVIVSPLQVLARAVLPLLALYLGIAV